MTILRSNHLLFTSQQEIRDICKLLFKFAGLNYFDFRRTYKDGSYAILSSNSEWPLYFITKKVPIKTPIADYQFTNKKYVCLWEGNIPDQTLSDAKNHYGIKNAIAYVEKNEEYFDSFSFASGREGLTIATYFSNLEVFLKFSAYFHEKAFKLINEAISQRITVTENLKDLSLEKLLSNDNFFCGKEDFLKAIALKKITILTKNGSALITKREAECVEQLARGKSKKEAGIILGLSARTIETHLEKAKNKLSCFTVAELVDLWWKNQG